MLGTRFVYSVFRVSALQEFFGRLLVYDRESNEMGEISDFVGISSKHRSELCLHENTDCLVSCVDELQDRLLLTLQFNNDSLAFAIVSLKTGALLRSPQMEFSSQYIDIDTFPIHSCKLIDDHTFAIGGLFFAVGRGSELSYGVAINSNDTWYSLDGGVTAAIPSPNNYRLYYGFTSAGMVFKLLLSELGLLVSGYFAQAGVSLSQGVALWTWDNDITTGEWEPLDDSPFFGTAVIKCMTFIRPPVSSLSSNTEVVKYYWKYIAVVAVVCAVLIAAILSSVLLTKYWQYRRRKALESIPLFEKRPSLDLVSILTDPEINLIDPDDLVVLQPIGKGGTSEVCKVQWKDGQSSNGSCTSFSSKSCFALKKLGLCWYDEPRTVERLYLEIKLLSRLRHPNILKFHGVVVDRTPGHCTLSLLLEYMERGSLDQALVQYKEVFTLELRQKLALDCAQAMEYLHSHHVIHRDLKPANLLVRRKHLNCIRDSCERDRECVLCLCVICVFCE